jgi:hypothetical protein
MKQDSSRLTAVDAGAIAVISVAICLAAHRLLLMTVLVPVVLALRWAAIWFLRRREGVNIRAEFIFFLLCIGLGAFNDWNSVCNRKIYEYTVPHYFGFSTIPIWMLLFWGMILRFVARLARWQALKPGTGISNAFGPGRFSVDSKTLKVAAALVLVFGTRQAIYRFYLDPILSWLPFFIALAILLILFRPNRHDGKLIGLFLIGGPLIEVLYIKAGGLHRYHLGWIGGVPLWIVLWWLVIVVIWKDLAYRIERGLHNRIA